MADWVDMYYTIEQLTAAMSKLKEQIQRWESEGADLSGTMPLSPEDQEFLLAQNEADVFDG